MSWWPIAFSTECSVNVCIERVAAIIKQYCFRAPIKHTNRSDGKGKVADRKSGSETEIELCAWIAFVCALNVNTYHRLNFHCIVPPITITLVCSRVCFIQCVSAHISMWYQSIRSKNNLHVFCAGVFARQPVLAVLPALLLFISVGQVASFTGTS